MIRKSVYILAISLALLNLNACKEEEKNRDSDIIKNDPIAFEKEGELYLLKNTGDTIKKLDIEIAETSYEHATGLMYRNEMEDTQAMLFTYPSAAIRNFYMKNTYFPLDIIYYDADSLLVSIQKNAQPRDETSLPSEAPAQFVLEINSGLSDDWNLEKGDKITFTKQF